MYDEEIFLITESETEEKDQYGDPVVVEEKRSVLAAVKSIGMREFYQAQSIGMKPEIVFELADYFDYDGEKKIEYGGSRYNVLRTYRKGIGLEITCYGGVRNVGA